MTDRLTEADRDRDLPAVHQDSRQKGWPFFLLDERHMHLRLVANVLQLARMSRDDLRVQLEHRHIEKLITEVDRSSNRLVIGLVLAALIVASALVLRTELHSWWLSVPIYLLSSLLGAWLVYGIFRSGRL